MRRSPLRPAPPLRGLLLLLMAAGLAACDTGSALDETVVLTKSRTAMFSYACDARPAGQPHSVTAASSIDFTGQLDGFRAADVLSATVTGVQLVRRVPSGADLNDLVRDVRLSLVGSGGGVVAQAGTLPAATSAPLTPAVADVAALVRAGAFQPRLDFTVVQTQATECRLEAEITFRLELPGV